MKGLTFRIVVYACTISFLVSCHTKHKKSSKYDNIQKLMEQEFERIKDPSLNVVPTDRLLEAIEVRDGKLNTAQTLSGIQSVSTAVSGINWLERGPRNVGGRTRALWFDRSDAANGYKKVWAGGVGGGLWYTNDITAGSPVWNKVNDALENIAISSFVQSTTNPQIMYFGTGEGWENVDAVRGLGIWKTTDGGVTWTRLLSTSTFYFIQDLLIDNNGHLYAALRSNDQGGGSVGIQKSTDGGSTWTRVLDNSFAKSSRGADLELAANGDIYASMGTVTSNGGIYRSTFATHTTNTGNTGTWANITPNPAGAITDPNNFWQRIEIACAPSDPNTVYALFMGHGSNYDNCESIQRYNAASNSWTVGTVPTIVDQGSGSVFTRFQTFYNLIAAVDPNNANSLYIGGVDALRSKDGGSTWEQMTTWSLAGAVGFTPNQNVHADHHAIQFAPGSSSRAIWGTDGGVYYTSNANINGAGNKPTFTSKNSGYNVTQYYSVAMHPSNSNYFLAGAQDNGTHKFSSSGINNVSSVSGGDGGLCHIDRDDPTIQISSYVLNNYYVSTDGGINFEPRSKNDRGRFINPTDYDDASNILYCGDSAKSFFRWTNPAADGTAENVLVSAFGNSAVTHVAVSPSTVNRVYFGLTNGSIVRVDNANAGTSLTGTVVKTGTGWVSCIAIDPANEDHMLVTYSNYGAAMVSVFESTNALSASPVFTSVEGDLPDMPVRWAMFDPRNSDWALLATELGVWSTDNLNAGGTTNWSPTNSGLANVRVDMLQYRTSDQTIVAATHGRGLFTAVLPPVTTPDINFNTGTTSAIEQTTNTSGCRAYRDYPVLMSIKNAPAGNATVTVTIQGGATATQGVDYDYTTNGNFTTPSNTFVFTNAAVETKTINLRVYNDAQVESSETFIMTYSITGATNAQAGIAAQTHVVTIEDNDVAPAAFSSGAHVVGTVDYYIGSDTASSPFDARVQSKRSQILYKASELTGAGATAGNLTSIAFYLEKHSTRPIQNIQIKMGASSLNNLVEFPSYFPQTLGLVKTIASYATVNGWNTFTLDAPFYWDGTSNIVVEVCYNNGTADVTQAVDRAVGYLDGGTASQGNMFYQNINCASAFGGVTYFAQGLKPIVRFDRTASGTTVASAVTTRSEYLGPNSDLYFYNSAGEIMAKVKNLSSHNYGCVDVILDRAGTGATAFWNNNVGNRIMNKSFRIVPTTNNALGSYEITLYYLQAEVAGWEATTGQSFNNIQLIKTAGPVSAVTPAAPNASGSIDIVTPVRGTFGSNYTLTYTFNNGFSGFGAGVAGAALPVTLLDFVGLLKSHNVVLDWKTSFESNSSGFEIERSYDGASFTKIGFVKAAGNSNILRRYTFTDREITQVNNYYRLKQVDLDGKFIYSKVIVINNVVTTGIPFTLLNNPVHSSIDIQFGEAGVGKVQLRFTDISGKLIKLWSGEKVTNRRVRIDISDRNLSKGVYILHATVNGKEYSEKVIVK